MISENTHIGISEATSATQSNSSCSKARGEDLAGEAADPRLVGVARRAA